MQRRPAIASRDHCSTPSRGRSAVGSAGMGHVLRRGPRALFSINLLHQRLAIDQVPEDGEEEFDLEEFDLEEFDLEEFDLEEFDLEEDDLEEVDLEEVELEEFDNLEEDDNLVDDRLDERLQNKNTTISQACTPLRQDRHGRSASSTQGW